MAPVTAGPPPDERRCVQITAEGERCKNWARNGEDTCWRHDPCERCVAHITGGNTDQHRAGQQCLNRRVEGTTVCEYHGGKSGHTRRAVKRRMTETRARRMVQTYGLKVDTTPEQAILDEVQWTAGHVAWLRERVQGIIENDTVSVADLDGDDEYGDLPAAVDEHPLVWGVTKRKTGGDDRGVTEEAGGHIWLRLYQQERAHLVKVCAEAIRCGIEERRVKLAEQDGALVAGAIRGILDDLHLTPQQQALVAQVVPNRLRQLAAATN
jgi:hypothetical protein